jgi:hypothetical protein
MDYTQYGEQSFLNEYAKKINGGFLVDIGAADGVIHSNSKWLIDQGWSALLVEPNKYNFNKLVNLHKDNNKVIIEHCGCSDKTLKDVKFFINKNDDMEQCSTFSEEFSINVKKRLIEGLFMKWIILGLVLFATNLKAELLSYEKVQLMSQNIISGENDKISDSSINKSSSSNSSNKSSLSKYN